MKNNRLLILLACVGAYLISTGLSYMVFSQNSPESTGTAKNGKVDNDYGALSFDDGKPRTESCPLNGVKYSKDQRAWWESHRPLGVMIENSTDARPQSGLSFADTVYEAVAEGGITRFLAVYHCQDAGFVGPVRSARTYFLDYISEYGSFPLYAHVGGANTPGPADALGQIIDYGWSLYNDLSQFSIGYPTFKRDEARLGRSVATEHTMYATTRGLWKVAEERDLTEKDEDGEAWDEEFTAYKFKDDAAVSARPASQVVDVDFWSNYASYSVEWVYNKESNMYARNNGGAKHIDNNTDKQLMVKNIVVLYVTEARANDGYEGNLHMIYGTKGSGDAVVIMDGKKINATWEKEARTDRTILTDSSGDEIKFNRGQIWFQIVPEDSLISVK